MTSDSAQNDAETFELPADASWKKTVELFEAAAASWLTPADGPQLMALRSIARELDGGKFQAALISQFTLVHRALLARRPGEPPAAGGDGSEGGLQPTMFEFMGGKMWRGDA